MKLVDEFKGANVKGCLEELLCTFGSDL